MRSTVYLTRAFLRLWRGRGQEEDEEGPEENGTYLSRFPWSRWVVMTATATSSPCSGVMNPTTSARRG